MLKDRIWTYPQCGSALDRNANAAKKHKRYNIAKRKLLKIKISPSASGIQTAESSR